MQESWDESIIKAVGTKIYCVIADRLSDRINDRLNPHHNLVWSALSEKTSL